MATQPDYSGSCMIALYPPPDIAAALAVPGGLDPAELHVTLAYTGKARDVDHAALLAAAHAIRAEPFTAQVSGTARFTGGEKGDVLVALIDAPQIEDLRAAALAALKAHGVTVPREHGYTAHLTRRYVPPGDPDETGRLAGIEIPFTALSVVHGEQRTDLPLTPPPAPPAPPGLGLAEAAREAYARGWALSGGRMTARVKTGCAAAVALALDHPHAPGVLEATLHLGHLEGTWAIVFDRRDELIAQHTEHVTAAWKQVLTRDQLAAAVSDFRRRAGLTETLAPDKQRLAELKDAALLAAAAMLQALRNRPEWRALARAIRNALAAGRAEGIVDAVAIAAEQVHRTGLNWDIAFEHAYSGLADLTRLWADADGWLGKLLERATGDLSRALANAAAAEATYAQMLNAAMDALDGQDVDAVAFTVDWALSAALSRGALDLYAAEDVAQADWITAMDSRVCDSGPNCEALGENSPYPLGDFPDQPAHPRCRCASAASFDLANYASWFIS